MKLKDASRKYKFENTTTYYFDNDYGLYFTIIVTKNKSGYEIETYDSKSGVYRRTDGLRNMEQVNKFIN